MNMEPPMAELQQEQDGVPVVKTFWANIGEGKVILSVNRATEIFCPLRFVNDLLLDMNKRRLNVFISPMIIRNYYLTPKETKLFNTANQNEFRGSLGDSFKVCEGLVPIKDVRQFISEDKELKKRFAASLSVINEPRERPLEPLIAELNRAQHSYVKLFEQTMISIYCQGRQYVSERAVRNAVIRAFYAVGIQKGTKLYSLVPFVFMNANDVKLFNHYKGVETDPPIEMKWFKQGDGLLPLDDVMVIHTKLAAEINKARTQGDLFPMENHF